MINLQFGVKNLKFLDKGKRSLVYTGLYKNKKVAVKIKNPKSKAENKIAKEAYYLKILNKYDIGPKIIKSNNDCLVYEFVEGERFIDFIKNKDKEKIKIISKKILRKCRTLDKLKINKLEFMRPIKHIFVKGNKIGIIDFERCYKTEYPKNVTQFCQFLISRKIIKKQVINKLKKYKKNQTEANFKEILNSI